MLRLGWGRRATAAGAGADRWGVDCSAIDRVAGELLPGDGGLEVGGAGTGLSRVERRRVRSGGATERE